MVMILVVCYWGGGVEAVYGGVWSQDGAMESNKVVAESWVEWRRYAVRVDVLTLLVNVDLWVSMVQWGCGVYWCPNLTVVLQLFFPLVVLLSLSFIYFKNHCSGKSTKLDVLIPKFLMNLQ